MPSELYIGGGVYMPIEAGVDYWPVVGVTEPQNFWPFNVTGDYTDQGSVGGANLTEQGSGNSFGANGLVLNGSGYANFTGDDPGFYDLGLIYSVLVEYLPAATTGYQCCMCCGAHDTNGFELFGVYNEAKVRWYSSPSGGIYSSADIVSTSVMNQMIVTQNGSGANGISIYRNGSIDLQGQSTTSSTAVGGIAVGGILNGTYPFTGTIKRVGILKGTVWSATDVAAIYAAL